MQPASPLANGVKNEDPTLLKAQRDVQNRERALKHMRDARGIFL